MWQCTVRSGMYVSVRSGGGVWLREGERERGEGEEGKRGPEDGGESTCEKEKLNSYPKMEALCELWVCWFGWVMREKRGRDVNEGYTTKVKRREGKNAKITKKGGSRSRHSQYSGQVWHLPSLRKRNLVGP